MHFISALFATASLFSTARLYACIGLACLVYPCTADDSVDKVDNRRSFEVEFDSGKLTAKSARFGENSDGEKVISLHNALYVRAPWLFLAEELQLYESDNHLTGEGIEFEYGNTASGTADRLVVNGADDNEKSRIVLGDFAIQFCAGDEEGPGWGLEGLSLQLDGEAELATVRRMSMRVMGLRLPGPPVARMPLDGRSVAGLLAPQIQLNHDDEADITLPILLTLGPSADLTLAPRISGSSGSGLESELRYVLNNQSGRLVGVSLDTETGSWQGQYWSHRGQFGRWKLELDYTRLDEESFLSRYGLATVTIPRVSGLYPQTLKLSYRGEKILAEIARERFNGPVGGQLGDHSSNFELRFHLMDSLGPWFWQIEVESGDYGWSGSELFAKLRASDRPLGAADQISRHLVRGETGWRYQGPEGWVRLQLQLARTDQDSTTQRSLGFELDTGLRFGAGRWQFHPRLQHLSFHTKSSGELLQNLDTSLLPASALSLWQNPIAGGDLPMLQDRLTVGADLHHQSGHRQLRLSAAAALYSRVGGDALQQSLLTALSGLPSGDGQRARILEFEWRGRTGSLQQSLLVQLSRGDSAADDREVLTWSLAGAFGSTALRRSNIGRGGGLNGALRFAALSLKAQLTERWHLTLGGRQDLDRDRRIGRSLSLGYESCCLRFGIGISNSLYTDYRNASEQQWLNWQNLPVREWSNTLFSFSLKTGTIGTGSP